MSWPRAVLAAPEGEMRWGLHVTLAARWLDPAETEAFNTPFMVMYAVHDALVRPMPTGLMTPSLAESWMGNAATRLEPYATKDGIYAYGYLPQVEDLYVRQGRESDPKKREAQLHQIQTILHEHVMHVPIYELAFIWGVGPRVEESGAGLIPGFAYSAPFEDLRLRK
jgi:ABC-type transport system substrate-binding protein